VPSRASGFRGPNSQLRYYAGQAFAMMGSRRPRPQAICPGPGGSGPSAPLAHRLLLVRRHDTRARRHAAAPGSSPKGKGLIRSLSCDGSGRSRAMVQMIVTDTLLRLRISVE
jgi:hypothetical protein